MQTTFVKEKMVPVKAIGTFVLIGLVGFLLLVPEVFAHTSPAPAPPPHEPTFLGDCNGLEHTDSFTSTHQTDTKTRCEPDDRTYTTWKQWYEADNGDTCYVNRSETKVATNCNDGSSSPDRDDIVAEIIYDAIAIQQVRAAENAKVRHRERNFGFQETKRRRRPQVSGSAPSCGYESSELPTWAFNASVQGTVSESETAFTPTIGVKSDVKSIAFNLSAKKDDFNIFSQLYYTGLRGTGLSDGQDTDSFGVMIMPGYLVLNQEANGIDLSLAGFLEVSGNNYEEGSQTRFVPGLGFNATIMTPIGGFTLSDLFSHDRNLNGDTEITGYKYLNMNTLTFAYLLPLSETLFLTTNVDYMNFFDMPDDMEDSSTGIGVALEYYGWEGYNVGLRYNDTLNGFEDRGVVLTVGHSW